MFLSYFNGYNSFKEPRSHFHFLTTPSHCTLTKAHARTHTFNTYWIKAMIYSAEYHTLFARFWLCWSPVCFFILFDDAFFLFSPTKCVLKLTVSSLNISSLNLFTKICQRSPTPPSFLSSSSLNTKFIKIIVKHKILWMLNRYTQQYYYGHSFICVCAATLSSAFSLVEYVQVFVHFAVLCKRKTWCYFIVFFRCCTSIVYYKFIHVCMKNGRHFLNKSKWEKWVRMNRALVYSSKTFRLYTLHYVLFHFVSFRLAFAGYCTHFNFYVIFFSLSFDWIQIFTLKQVA